MTISFYLFAVIILLAVLFGVWIGRINYISLTESAQRVVAAYDSSNTRATLCCTQNTISGNPAIIADYFTSRIFRVYESHHIHATDYVILQDINDPKHETVFLVKANHVLCTDSDGQILHLKKGSNYLLRTEPLNEYHNKHLDKNKNSTLYVYKLFAQEC